MFSGNLESCKTESLSVFRSLGGVHLTRLSRKTFATETVREKLAVNTRSSQLAVHNLVQAAPGSNLITFRHHTHPHRSSVTAVIPVSLYILNISCSSSFFFRGFRVVTASLSDDLPLDDEAEIVIARLRPALFGSPLGVQSQSLPACFGVEITERKRSLGSNKFSREVEEEGPTIALPSGTDWQEAEAQVGSQEQEDRTHGLLLLLHPAKSGPHIDSSHYDPRRR